MIEMITTVIWYKFEQLSRSEIEAMLDIPVEETRLYQEGVQEGRQEGRKEGRLEGRQEGEVAVILRLLHKRLGEIPEEVRKRISALSLADVERLSDEFLEFATVMDVQTWLDKTSI